MLAYSWNIVIKSLLQNYMYTNNSCRQNSNKIQSNFSWDLYRSNCFLYVSFLVLLYIFFLVHFYTIIIVHLFLNSFPLFPRNILGPLIKIHSSKITIPFTKLKIVYPKIVYSNLPNWKSSIKNRLFLFYQILKNAYPSIHSLFWTSQQWRSVSVLSILI